VDLDCKPALCGSQGFLTCPRHCGREGKVGHCDGAAGLGGAQRGVSGQDGMEAVLDGSRAAAAGEYEVAEGFVFGEEGFLLGDGVAGDIPFGDAAEGGECFPLVMDGAVCPVGQVRCERVRD
jgi:hypothetical protein